MNIHPAPSVQRASRLPRTGCLVGVFLFGLVMLLPLMAGLMGIWPGVMKLTAPVLCPAGYDDPVVASDTSSVRPGETSTSFTMYCLNDRGEAEELGVLRPMALVFAVVVALYLLVVIAFVVASAVRSRRRRPVDALAWPPT